MDSNKDIISRENGSNRLELDEQIEQLFDALMDRYHNRKFHVNVPSRDKKSPPVELTPEMLLAMVKEVMSEESR